MSNDKYYADIRALLETNGDMGVNAIAKALNVPLSTMQKYLDKDQNYFKKTHARKWALPEKAAQRDMSVVSENYTNIVDSQLMSMNALFETLMSQFRATVTLMEANKPLNAAVADVSGNIDPQLIELDKKLKETHKIFNQYKKNIPEEYVELMMNTDITKLAIKVGSEYFNNMFNDEIAGILLGKITELSEDTIEILKEYQKGE